MNNKFDELAKGLAQSVTRRQALKRFGVGLAGMALACFGLASKAEADQCSCHYADPCCCSHMRTTLSKHCPNYTYCALYCAI